MRDHIGFSVVAIGVLFIVLRLLGVRSTFAGFAMSVAITLALNVGLSYYQEHRARNPRPQRQVRGGGDIRFREDDRRHDPRDVDHRDIRTRDVDDRERTTPRRRAPRDEIR